MKRNSDTIKENLNMCALLIEGNKDIGLTREGLVFGLHIEQTAIFGRSRAAYGIAKIRSTKEPSTVPLRKRFKRVGGFYTYRLYLADIRVGGDWSILIAAPMRELLPDIRKETNLQYCRCDLRVIFNDQFIGPQETNVSVSRLNARIFGDSRAKSIALYGNGLIAADVLKDILGDKLVKRKGGPFPKVNTGDARIGPNSCRLVWDDGQSKPFALNIDIFGNYSFYLRDFDEMQALISILKYVDGLGAIKADVEMDPLRRSTAALKRVSE